MSKQETQGRISLAAILLLATIAGCLCPAPTWSEEDKTFNVGLRLMDSDFSHPKGGKQTITVAVWYPTEQAPQPFTYHAEETFKSSLVVNAPVAAKSGPYPLVVFAHGAYGSGYNSAFFTEYLACHGYVVAAADYDDMIPPAYRQQVAFSRMKSGNTAKPMAVVAIAGRFVADMNRDRERFFNYLAEHRLPQTSFVIDEVLRLSKTPDSALYQAVKETEIGLCGHSLGGATTLGKIGPHPDPKLKDERIKAALLFSAPAYPFDQRLNHVTVPVMVMAGDQDSPAAGPDLPRRTVYDKVRPPKFYLVLKDATHFAFGNRACKGLPTYQAVESVPQVSAICRYGLAFFDKHVRKDMGAARQLDETSPALAYYVKEESPGQTREWGKEPPADRTGGPGGIRKEIRDDIRRRLKGE